MIKSVSVLLTVHKDDASSQLDTCIRSILHQTIAVDEIIIIDVSHRDDIYDVIVSFSSQWNNIRYYNEYNMEGELCLKEMAAQLATHEWIAFIKSSEVWLTDKTERQLEALENPLYSNPMMVLSDYYMGKCDLEVLGLIDAHLINRKYDISLDKNAILLEYEPWLFSGMMIRRSAFLAMVEPRRGENEWAFLVSLLRSRDYVFLKQVYFIHKDIETLNQKLDMVKNNFEALGLLKEDILCVFGQSYWNDIVRCCYKKAQNLNYEEIAGRTLDLFDYDSRIKFREFKNIDSYFFDNEVECLEKFCSSHKHIGCYGAGGFADQILRFLKKRGLTLDCVIVSDGQRNKSALYEAKIYECSDIDLHQLDGIILAMDLRAFPRMKEELQSKYFGDIFTVTYSFYSFLQLDNKTLLS